MKSATRNAQATPSLASARRAKRAQPLPQPIAPQAELLPSEDLFPQRLRSIPDSPKRLFVAGDVRLLGRPALAVVGTREGTGQAYAQALTVARHAAQSGYVVVSGLAIGCDLMAHIGCLWARGKTVAVLAHGLHEIYPPAHATYARWILEAGGALVTEYPLGTRPASFRFIARDRLQSALSDAVVVIQTRVRGGTMHTVNAALAQGRPVFCWCPADPDPDAFSGNLMLVESGKATPFTDWSDLASRLAHAPQPAHADVQIRLFPQTPSEQEPAQCPSSGAGSSTQPP